MNRFGFVCCVLLASILLINSGCHAKQAFLEFTNDPHYPQLITVSNVQYQLVGDRYLDFSGVLTIYEELNDGTNVSWNLKRNRDRHLISWIEFIPFSRSNSMYRPISRMLAWLTTWMWICAHFAAENCPFMGNWWNRATDYCQTGAQSSQASIPSTICASISKNTRCCGVVSTRSQQSPYTRITTF